MRQFRYLKASLAAAILHTTVAHGGVITNVDEASDVCPVVADPCIITDTVEIVDGTSLDFGARRVEVRGDGVLDVGVGTAEIVCGSFAADSPGRSIANVREAGVDDTGWLSIFAAGTCSADASVLCFTASDCGLGGQCLGDPRGIDVNARIIARSKRFGANIRLYAAGDVTIRDLIDVSADDGNDAGDLKLAAGGNLLIEGPIVAVGGAHGSGGYVFTDADGDTLVHAPIDVSGGELDGGVLSMASGANTVIAADLTANGHSYGGWGGDIDVTAGADVILSEGVRIAANGSTGRGSNGDGGTIGVTAGGNAYLEKARYSVRGGRRYGGGGAVFVDSEGDTTISGRWIVGARGRYRGLFAVHAKRDLMITAGTLVDIRSGGIVDLQSDRDMFFDGYLRQTHVVTDPVSLDVEAGRAMSIGARIDIVGAGVSGYARFTAACSMDLLPSAKIRAFTDLTNSFVAKSFAAASGSYVESPLDSAFRVITASETPPVLNGTFKPAPVLSTSIFVPCS